MHNDRQCPLCQGQNHCNSDFKELCWCMKKTFPESIFRKLSKDQLRKACICETCLKDHKRAQLIR